MELNIIEFDSLVLGSSSLGLIVGLIVKTQFKVRHSCELTVSIDDSNDFALDDVVRGANQHG